MALDSETASEVVDEEATEGKEATEVGLFGGFFRSWLRKLTEG